MAREHRRQRGAAAVETAVLGAFLIFLLLGIVDVGRAIFTRMAIEDAAEEGAAYGSLAEGISTADIEARVRAAVDRPDLSTATVWVTCLEDSHGNRRITRFVKVEVVFDQDLITPGAWIFTGPLRLRAAATSERFVEDHPAGCVPVSL